VREGRHRLHRPAGLGHCRHGNKAAAKRRMIEAKVPCVPGYQGADQSDGNLEREARKIGLRSWSRRLQVVADAACGWSSVKPICSKRSARHAPKAESAFGSGELILEKAVVDARHVEIQVFADAHGNVVHLGERDCSVQRRHQKVIEEAPSPAVDADLRRRMGAAAVAAAQAIDYRGAGTVEFLLGSDGGVLLPGDEYSPAGRASGDGSDHRARSRRMQLRVARGEKLPLTQDHIAFAGHAIEVRLYAEDAYAGFLPQTGRIDVWRPATAPVCASTMA
jgi:geranyl-CoA carboxylase alpha subunit